MHPDLLPFLLSRVRRDCQSDRQRFNELGRCDLNLVFRYLAYLLSVAPYAIEGVVSLAALRGGVCATLLLAIMFIAGFLGLKHAYGAGLLFIVATGFLGFALIRFAQEASISLNKHDEYH